MAEQSRFNTVAPQYAAGRPNYPEQLFAALEDALGRPLAGLDAVDLGAGTGIASRQLAERGARVTAVELSGPMLAELAASSPGVQAVQGSATALPLADDCADLVTCAQAWHWIDPARAVPEFRRVLRKAGPGRPGGLFAAWWNLTDRTQVWEREQEERIEAVTPGWRNTPFGREGAGIGPGLSVERRTFPWVRTLPLDRYLDNLASKSYIAALADPSGFLGAEREALLAHFPDGVVTERFNTLLFLVREPVGAGV